jgi:beta-lactamase regulating signal transducer with metallopeptidase domain
LPNNKKTVSETSTSSTPDQPEKKKFTLKKVSILSLILGLVVGLSLGGLMVFSSMNEEVSQKNFNLYSKNLKEAKNLYDKRSAEFLETLNEKLSIQNEITKYEIACINDPNGVAYVANFGLYRDNCNQARWLKGNYSGEFFGGTTEEELDLALNRTEFAMEKANENIEQWTGLQQAAKEQSTQFADLFENSKNALIVWAVLAFITVATLLVIKNKTVLAEKSSVKTKENGSESKLFSVNKTKSCPQCAEKIKAEAKLCKHCGSVVE